MGLQERSERAAAAMRRRAEVKVSCSEHEQYDPNCEVCIAANSDAPDWTI